MPKLDLKTLCSFLPLILVFAGLLLLNSHKTFEILTVSKVSVPRIMIFSGIVKPLKNINVLTPVDGTISRVVAKFGDTVKKGETLFTIESPQLETALRNGITAYLKAKIEFANQSYQSTGNAALYKAGLISKIEYMNSQDQFLGAKVALWDTNASLNLLLVGIGLDEQQIEKLSLNDIDSIKAVIARATGQLKIVSPTEGILSTQNKISSLASSSDTSSKGLTAGTVVKQGETVAIIYEMTGLNFVVDISETQFHDIRIGQKASITGNAFPAITLKGYVIDINHESNSKSSDTAPSYTIRIIVPKITPLQRKIIQEGMSAEITLTKDRPPSIRIPLTALIKKEDNYVVKKINPLDNTIQEVTVTPGDTDASTVAITAGLNEGDKIVIPD